LLAKLLFGQENIDEVVGRGGGLSDEGLNKKKKIIIEAGTGTGKTLAYLIPAIKWAVANKKKVIIATNTINLQEQLLLKDIPLAKSIIKEDFYYIDKTKYIEDILEDGSKVKLLNRPRRFGKTLNMTTLKYFFD